MLTAIVVDEELKRREDFKGLIDDRCNDVIVVGAAATVSEAKKIIAREKPHVVFLSVHKGNEIGFDLLDKIKEIDFEIVFVATDASNALKAIKYFALDYLVSPIELSELKAAVKKVKDKVEEKRLSAESIKVLLQNMNSPKDRNQKLMVPTTKGMSFLNIHDIIYCKGQGNYTLVHTCTGDQHMVSKTLKEYDSILSDHNFFRIHKSYLINLNEIKGYIQGKNSMVVMSNDDHLVLSQRRREEFFDTCILTNKTIIQKSNVINDVKYIASGNNQDDN